jgi:hypothetical protein
MSKKTYWEMLKDPRWQQMRLRVMEREQFMCQECGDGTTTLNVHHTYYERGKDPWDYPAESLHCLCEPCHAQASEERQKLLFVLAELSVSQQCMVRGFVEGFRLANNLQDSAVPESYEHLNGIVMGILHHEKQFDGYTQYLAFDLQTTPGPLDFPRAIETINVKREFNEMDAKEEGPES